MISPAYTPFTEYEVRHVLGLPRHAYIGAVLTGALTRSVHFDCRISPTTASHSLVDVVRFDAVFLNAPERTQTLEFAEQCDWWLDQLCDLDQSCEARWWIATMRDAEDVMRLLLPEMTERLSFDTTAAWHEELIVLYLVADSWCRCYRALYDMLVADEIKCNGKSISNTLAGWALRTETQSQF